MPLAFADVKESEPKRLDCPVLHSLDPAYDGLRVFRIFRREQTAIGLTAHRTRQASVHCSDPILRPSVIAPVALYVVGVDFVNQPVPRAEVHHLQIVLRSKAQSIDDRVGVPLWDYEPTDRTRPLLKLHDRGVSKG